MKNIIELLKNNKNIDEWKLSSVQDHSTELFFIKEELQMNRAKDVMKINLTVYKNFEEGEKKFKGSSTVKINPTDTDDELVKKINKAALAASFVKNQYYPIPEPTDKVAPKLESEFGKGDVVEIIAEMVKEVFAEDKQFDAFINSIEFFISTKVKRIVNSNGIDVTFDTYSALIEVITEAQGLTEEIELFEMVSFSDFDKAFVKDLIIGQLKNASYRAKAIKTPKLDGIPVIIDGKAINEMWGYYVNQAAAASKYQHLHENSIGDNVQGEDTLGDKVSIKLTPEIKNSPNSTYYDNDGLFLEEVSFLEDGVIKNMIADTRFAYYFDLKPTGGLRNFVVNGGQYTEEELRKGKYLEVLSFSAFQMDVMTGFFGGEFRLAIYHDGEKAIPVTQGAVSGNIKEAQKEMFLSKETIMSTNFVAPKIVKFNKMTIVGENK